MGPKDESTENAVHSSPADLDNQKANSNDTQPEEQAAAGAASAPDYTIHQGGLWSPGASSDDYSDNSFDGRSGDNDTASFASR